MTVDAQSFTVLLPSETAKVLGGTITLDEGWSPYVQASINMATPANLAAIDPRGGSPRVTVSVAQTFADAVATSTLTALWAGQLTSAITTAWAGLLTSDLTSLYSHPYNPSESHTEVARTFDLLVRGYSRSADGTTTVQLASDEALIQEWVTTGYEPVSTTLRDLINEVFQQVFGFLTTIKLEQGASNATVVPAEIPWEEGTTAWEYLSPLVQSAGMRLWCTEARVWKLDADPSALSGAITVDKPTGWSETVSRDGDWANAVSYTAPAPGGPLTNYAYATVSTPQKMLVIVSDIRSVGSGAVAAQAYLARANKRGKTLDVQAVNDWTTQTGMTATITIDPPATVSRRVTAVTFDLSSFEMDLSTREL